MPNSNGSATLEEYIDFALLLSAEEEIAEEKPCNPTEPTTPDYFHIPAVMSGAAHVMLATQEVLHNMAAIQDLSCKMAAT